MTPRSIRACGLLLTGALGVLWQRLSGHGGALAWGELVSPALGFGVGCYVDALVAAQRRQHDLERWRERMRRRIAALPPHTNTAADPCAAAGGGPSPGRDPGARPGPRTGAAAAGGPRPAGRGPGIRTRRQRR